MKGMWRFVDEKGQAWAASDYAFDEEYNPDLVNRD